MSNLPRLVIAAPSTGQGKTTVATGLMAALRLAGNVVSGHKIGPDYIDPGYHSLATGRPGRNLDPHLVGEDRVGPLLLHGAEGADVAIIEGVMGLHDGRLGSDGFASTAHVARLTQSPVVLVLDISRMSRTAAAVAAGMAAFDARTEISGVILNQTGSPRNEAEVVAALEGIGLPVLGRLPRSEELSTPSRHLGLVPAAERGESRAQLELLGDQVGRHLDLEALLAIAQQAPVLDVEPWNPAAEVVAPDGADPNWADPNRAAPNGADEVRRPVVAMAAGRAFTFRYAETEELLRAAGCDVIGFDPTSDPALPEGTRGIYLGGGFPEVYAADIAANHALLAQLRAAIKAGVPTVAECAGLLYLAESLDGVLMAGAVCAQAEMTSRLTLRYPSARALADTLLTRAGEEVTGHEFHRTHTTPASDGAGAWEIDGEPSGFATDTLHAAYMHVHWAGHPQLAQRFADAVHASVGLPVLDPTTEALLDQPSAIGPLAAASSPPNRRDQDPLLHHGDAELGEGLLDFAVNVYDGPRPGWLDKALHDSVDQVASYPNQDSARAALAQRCGRDVAEVLATAGAAEAFGLVARLRSWKKPVVVHPQFTEPHAALQQAGHQVHTVACRADRGFALEARDIPEAADLVILGNPTNPTGVLHPANLITALLRPGRLVLVDEAFMDAVPGEGESLLTKSLPGLVVLRSLTKHWSIPGVRAGFLVGSAEVVSQLRALQTPWSVSTTAIAALVECSQPQALSEGHERALTLSSWREHLTAGLRARGVDFVPSSAPFVLARLGSGMHTALRNGGVAVRRAETFPGLDSQWVRIAVRAPEITDQFFSAFDATSQRLGAAGQLDHVRKESP